MGDEFKKLFDELPDKYQCLISMQPVTIDTIPKDCPTGGVYLFSENGINLYTGRTGDKIKKRTKQHLKPPKSAVFIWNLICDKIGVEHTYRQGWQLEPQFKEAFESAKDRIRRMKVRFVGETNPVKRAILEIYAAVTSGSKYNDFDEH